MTAFDRYRPAMAVFFAGSMAVPIGFGAVVIKGGSPVTPEIYGELVWAIPALVWVGMQLSISAIALFGFATGRPIIAAIGAGLIAALMTFFAAAAILAGAGGTILVFGAGGWVGPVSLACAVTAWRGRDGRKGQ